MKKLDLKHIVYIITCLLVVLHPIIELDYLAYNFLDSIGLPRFTTVINCLIYPLLIVLTFFLFEKNKKKSFIFSLIYGILFLIYFYLHTKNSYIVREQVYLPENYWFSLFDELIYCLYLLIPLAYIWVFNKQEIKEETFKYIVYGISLFTGLPIFLGDIIGFGYSTYVGYTIDSIFSWFSLPFDEFSHHPRYYAGKFFFDEGNTIGILMTMILPLMYYFFLKEKDKIKKIIFGIMIFIHSLAMIILTTRVATLCAFLIPGVILFVYIILSLLKYENFNKLFISFLVIMTTLCALIYPYSPAYQNQQINAQTYVFQKSNDPQKAEIENEVREGAKGLEKYSPEWFGFYKYMFEAYSWLIRVTPPVYYLEFYDYKHDPEFWVNLIFDYELEERINGRQIQKIFTLYKWNDYGLNNYQKSLGLGYSTFMHGGIVIERDFARQYYMLGPIGFVLMMLPWALVLIYLGIKLLLGYKKKKWTMFNILLMMSICIGFGVSYLSGHTFDQLTTSMFIALLMGALFNNLKDKKEDNII